MPVAGLIDACDEIEIGVTSVLSGPSGSGTASNWVHTAELLTQYIFNIALLTPGFDIRVSSSDSLYYNVYDGFGAPSGGIIDSGAPTTNVSMYVIIKDYKLYVLNTGALFRSMASNVELWSQGVKIADLGGFDITSTGSSPRHIPLIGCPPIITSSVSVAGSGFEFDLTASQIVSGGYRAKRDGVWRAEPITLPDLSTVPSGGGPNCLGGLDGPSGIVVSTSTWGEHLHKTTRVQLTRICDSETNRGPALQSGYSTAGWVQLLPDQPKKIVRMCNDYAALVYRQQLPQATLRRSRTCQRGNTINIDGSNLTITNVTETPYAAKAPYLQRLTNNESSEIDETLNLPTFAPCAAAKSWGNAYNPDTDCGDDPAFPESNTESVGVTFPHTVQDDISNYLYHQDGLTRYCNTWGALMWHHFLFFRNWSGLDAIEYWTNAKQQYLYHSALPAAQNSRTRNHIIADLCEDSAHTPFLDNFVGDLRWIGLCRYKPRTFSIMTEYQLTEDSEDAWSAEDCTLTFGPTGITINITGPSPVITLDLQDFNRLPANWLGIATHMQQGYDASFDSIEAFLVGREGSAVSISTNEIKQRLPQGTQTKYAGSWAVDKGMGQVSDIGTDSTVDGMSLVTMSSEDTVHQFQLLSGAQGYKIEFVPDMAGAATSGVMDYPTFFFEPEDVPRLTNETGRWSNLTWPGGPSTRFGQFIYFLISLLPEPLVAEPPYTSTALDALCFGRETFEGVLKEDGTPTLEDECLALYDTIEGNEIGDVATATTSFILPIENSTEVSFALVNAVAEVPPLDYFPNSYYNEYGLPITGVGNYVYSWAQHGHRIASSAPLKILSPSDVLASVKEAEVLPWHYYRFNPVVMNDEAEDWKISQQTTKALFNPWSGFFAKLVGEEEEGGANPWTSVQHGYVNRTKMLEGDIVVELDDKGSGDTSRSTVLAAAGTISHPRIAYDELLHIHYLVFVVEDPSGTFNVKIVKSQDEGRTYSTAMTQHSNGKYPTVLSNRTTGAVITAAAKYVSGSSGPMNIYGRILAAGSETWTTEKVFKDPAGNPIEFAEDTFHITPHELTPGLYFLHARKHGSSATQVFVCSQDGFDVWEEL